MGARAGQGGRARVEGTRGGAARRWWGEKGKGARQDRAGRVHALAGRTRRNVCATARCCSLRPLAWDGAGHRASHRLWPPPRPASRTWPRCVSSAGRGAGASARIAGLASPAAAASWSALVLWLAIALVTPLFGRVCSHGLLARGARTEPRHGLRSAIPRGARR